jgi:hypothetical protein
MRRMLFYPLVSTIASLCFDIAASEQIVIGKEKGISGTTCPEHHYNIHLFSKDPLVIYIPNFITKKEASHLEEITYEKPFQNTKMHLSNSTLLTHLQKIPIHQIRSRRRSWK